MLKSGTRDLQRHGLRVLPRRALDARNPLEPDDTPQAAAAQASVRRHARRADRPAAVVLLRQHRGDRAREAETRLAHVPTAAERAGDFSQSGVALIDPFTQRPFAGNVVPAARLQRRRRGDCRALSVAQPRRRRRQLRVLAGGRAARHPVDDQDRSSRLARQPVLRPLQLQPRRSRSAVCRARAQPARLRRLGARPGPQLSPSAVADARAARLQRDSRRRQRPAPREHVADAPASTASPSSASRGRRSSRRPRLSRGRRARLREPRRRSQSAGRAAHADAPSLGQPVGSIAAATTSSSAASCDTTARTASITCTRAARRRSPAPTPAIRSATCCSACRPTRCSRSTTTARRCGRGRPTSSRRTTGASRRR